jgi:hypothetical protein
MKSARGVLPAVRAAGFVLLAAAAVYQFWVWTPDSSAGGAIDGEVIEAETFGFLTQAANQAYDENEESTYDDSAPKQTVRNGWLANDLQQVELRQNAELLRAAEVASANQAAMIELESDSAHRMATVLLVGVIALIWHGLTLPWAFNRRLPAPEADRRSDLPPPPPGHRGASAPPHPAS